MENQARQDFAGYRSRPETVLAVAVPLLREIDVHLKECQASGKPVSHHLGVAVSFAAVEMPKSVPEAGNDAASQSAASRAVQALSDINGTPSDGYADAVPRWLGLTSGWSMPEFDKWCDEGLSKRVKAELATLRRAAVQEADEEDRIAEKASVAPGTTVAIMDPYGVDVPSGFAKVVRLPGGALGLDDGSTLSFHSHGRGSWIARKPDGHGSSVRVAKPDDTLLVRLHKGLLSEGLSPLKAKQGPSKGFTARLQRTLPRLLSLDSHLSTSTLLGATLPGLSYGNLHSYVNRRFGLPPRGGDDYKDLTGRWFLDTPRQDVFMEVSPSVSGAEFSISFYGTGELASGLEKARRKAASPSDYMEMLASVTRAARSALLDLLRPTNQRDSSLNALGPVEDGNPFLSHSVPYAASSTIGLPPEFSGMDRGALYGLVAALQKLDPSSMETAARLAAGILQATAAATAEKQVSGEAKFGGP